MPKSRWAERPVRVLALLLTSAALVLAVPTAAAATLEAPVTGGVDDVPLAPTDEPLIVPAVPAVPDVPSVTVMLDGEDGALSSTVTVLVLLTVGSVAPALLLLTTSFTRFIVVLGLTKNALGLQTVPPSQVLVGLALFLAFFSMGPTFERVNEDAVQPYLAGEIEQGDAFAAGFAPIRDFMLSQTREEDLQLFIDLAGAESPGNPEEVAAATLIPAFVISELRAAFIMGFMVFVPFLVVDLVVAAVLMSMGMMMLPPVFISLPVKLLLFVLVDGWVLIAGSLVRSVAV